MKKFYYSKKDGLWWFKFKPKGTYITLTSDQGFKRKSDCKRSAKALERGKGFLVTTNDGFYQVEWKNRMGQLLAAGLPHLSSMNAESDLKETRIALKRPMEPQFRYLATAIVVGVIVALFIYVLTTQAPSLN